MHWAHQVRDRFPDGQLYVNLRGFDPGGTSLRPGEALRGLLDGLGVPPARIPADLPSQAALYRSVLAGRRMLILLDNAGDADQVRPLLPGDPGCLVIVTSRDRLTGLVAADGADPLLVDVLSGGEARTLLARRIGEARVRAEPRAADEIIAACARLPLALAIIAARAATHPGFPLAAIAAELRDARSRLDSLTGFDPATDLRAVFSWSYRTLSPAAARVFRLLSLHRAAVAGVHTVASLAGLPAGRVRRLLVELCEANLLAEQVPGRFGCHDLLRDYARDLAEQTDSEIDRHAATVRILDHYVHTALAGDRLVDPARPDVRGRRPPAAAAGVTCEPLPDVAAVMAWFAAEQRALRAAVEHAAAIGCDTRAWWLAWATLTCYERRFEKQDWVAVQEIAAAIAERSGDPVLRSVSQFNLGYAYGQLGSADRYRAHLTVALDLYRQLGDVARTAHVHLNLGIIARQQGRYQEALDEGEQALSQYREIGDLTGQARALNNVGWCHLTTRDFERALGYCRQAVAMHEAAGNRMGAAHARDSLGMVHHQLGRHDEALACYRGALALFRDQHDRKHEAIVLAHIGDTHAAAGSRLAARDVWRLALDVFAEIDHPDADEVRAKLSAREEVRATAG